MKRKMLNIKRRQKKMMTKEARRLMKKQSWSRNPKDEAVKAARLVETMKMVP